jgi:hypothetical protein
MDEKAAESSSVSSFFVTMFYAPNIAVGCMIADRSGTLMLMPTAP